jgi:hypothetical protein
LAPMSEIPLVIWFLHFGHLTLPQPFDSMGTEYSAPWWLGTLSHLCTSSWGRGLWEAMLDVDLSQGPKERRNIPPALGVSWVCPSGEQDMPRPLHATLLPLPIFLTGDVVYLFPWWVSLLKLSLLIACSKSLIHSFFFFLFFLRWGSHCVA